MTNLPRVHILAHSLGNRITLKALEAAAGDKRTPRPLVGELVLASADVGVSSDFTADVALLLPEMAHAITQYYNPSDKALWVSEKLHRESRIGQVRTGLSRDGGGRPTVWHLPALLCPHVVVLFSTSEPALDRHVVDGRGAVERDRDVERRCCDAPRGLCKPDLVPPRPAHAAHPRLGSKQAPVVCADRWHHDAV